MQGWEAPLMRSMASIVHSGDDVLEVGYGLGLCSAFIQRRKPRSHLIVEMNSLVAARARRRLYRSIDSGRTKILEGFWESVLRHTPRSFDAIVFDTYPL